MFPAHVRLQERTIPGEHIGRTYLASIWTSREEFGVKKILKVGLGGDLLACLAAAAQREQVAETELVRRALWLYFGAAGPAEVRPAAGQAVLPLGSGPGAARKGPESGPRPAAAGGSPPLSPLHSPHPPSLSPPLPSEKQVGASPDGAAETVLAFPCIRQPGSGEPEWALTRRQIERWEAVFPDMDVLGEMRKAQEYQTLRPERRKTARGMPKFLFAWLTRGQDNGRYLRRPSPAAAAGSAASAASAPGAAGAAATLLDEYGFESWEQWDAKLRDTLTGDTLDEALASLGKLRRRWDEGRRGA
jgi:hypothetical protein